MTDRPVMLTAVEKRVLSLLADGLSTAEISAVMTGRANAHPKSAQHHIDLAMRKLNARTRVHAVVTAIRDGHIK